MYLEIRLPTINSSASQPLNLFSGELYLEAKDGSKDHLNIFDKTIVTVIVAIQSYFIRIYDVIVIPHRQLLIRQSLRYLQVSLET